MSITKVSFTRGIKGKSSEGRAKEVTFEAVGKVETVTRTIQKGERKGESETVSELIEDGIVTDEKEAISLLPNPQDRCNALVRHFNRLAYQTAVEAIVGVEVPDELDELMKGII